MRLTLKDFQTSAVEKTLLHLHSARRDAALTDQAVVLSAPTGSGKTVIATAVIETVLFGSDTAPGDPGAVFLWITDQPELNEQTRRKMVSTSSKLGPDRLVVIESEFDEEKLTPGRVYFVNTQKLGSGGNLVKGTGDLRTWTFWDTINNTLADGSIHLTLVIDEAHRGMAENARQREQATSIIQKFLKGNGEVRSVPLVLGISATPQRFEALLAGTERTKRPVTVTPPCSCSPPARSAPCSPPAGSRSSSREPGSSCGSGGSRRARRSSTPSSPRSWSWPSPPPA